MALVLHLTFFAPTSSSDEANVFFNSSIKVDVNEKDQNCNGTGGRSLDSAGLIDLKKSIFELQNVDKVFKTTLHNKFYQRRVKAARVHENTMDVKRKSKKNLGPSFASISFARTSSSMKSLMIGKPLEELDGSFFLETGFLLVTNSQESKLTHMISQVLKRI